jgi:NADH:ubiquinone oxidoreductase subunit D
MNHCLGITTHFIDLGLLTTMLWGFEEREKMFNIMESITGSRYHIAILSLGINRYNITDSNLNTIIK